jgi:hypothetical protein
MFCLLSSPFGGNAMFKQEPTVMHEFALSYLDFVSVSTVYKTSSSIFGHGFLGQRNIRAIDLEDMQQF